MGIRMPDFGMAPAMLKVAQCLSRPESCEIFPTPVLLSPLAVRHTKSPSPMLLLGSSAIIQCVPALPRYHGFSYIMGVFIVSNVPAFIGGRES